MERVRYGAREGVAWIEIDDGRMNVMSPEMQAALHEVLDRAEADGAVTVLRGRPGVFSAGFDLAVLRGGDAPRAAGMVLGGFELAARVLAHPQPVLMVCTGHAVAMGLFLLLAGDYRLGTRSPARLVANEVAIGLTLPRSAEVLLRHRLTPSAFQRAALLSAPFDPRDAVEVGVFDETTDPEKLDDRAAELAHQLAQLDGAAHRATKARARSGLMGALAAALALDRAELLGAAAGRA